MNARRNLLFALLLGCTASAIAQPAPVLNEGIRHMAERSIAAGYPSIVIGIVDGGRKEIVGFGSSADDRKRAPDGASPRRSSPTSGATLWPLDSRCRSRPRRISSSFRRRHRLESPSTPRPWTNSSTRSWMRG